MKFDLKQFNRNVPDEELLADLVLAHAKLTSQGKDLTFRTYGSVGRYGAGTINTRFGTWNNALQKAGINIRQEKNVSVEALFDNLKLVWIARGRQPTFRDMSAVPSQYTASLYSSRFGGWRKALEKFVASVDFEQAELSSNNIEVKKNVGAKRTKRDPSLALRFLVLKRDNFRCVACGRSPATNVGLVLEVDHVLAWSKDGETVEQNLRTLCFDCNRGKGST
jgi:hypothetical protein